MSDAEDASADHPAPLLDRHGVLRLPGDPTYPDAVAADAERAAEIVACLARAGYRVERA